jgi:hypothetical protein
MYFLKRGVFFIRGICALLTKVRMKWIIPWKKIWCTRGYKDEQQTPVHQNFPDVTLSWMSHPLVSLADNVCCNRYSSFSEGKLLWGIIFLFWEMQSLSERNTMDVYLAPNVSSSQFVVTETQVSQSAILGDIFILHYTFPLENHDSCRIKPMSQ